MDKGQVAMCKGEKAVTVETERRAWLKFGLSSRTEGPVPRRSILTRQGDRMPLRIGAGVSSVAARW